MCNKNFLNWYFGTKFHLIGLAQNSDPIPNSKIESPPGINSHSAELKQKSTPLKRARCTKHDQSSGEKLTTYTRCAAEPQVTDLFRGKNWHPCNHIQTIPTNWSLFCIQNPRRHLVAQNISPLSLLLTLRLWNLAFHQPSRWKVSLRVYVYQYCDSKLACSILSTALNMRLKWLSAGNFRIRCWREIVKRRRQFPVPSASRAVAAVDTNCRMKGVESLRTVDGNVFPFRLGWTSSYVYAVADQVILLLGLQ
jgi:hypothetical protein